MVQLDYILSEFCERVKMFSGYCLSDNVCKWHRYEGLRQLHQSEAIICVDFMEFRILILTLLA